MAVGAVLLFWIFHSIFYQEARTAAEMAGIDWGQLSKSSQWQLAWTEGPVQLWKTISLIPATSLALSIALMGSTILLGVVRWRMVLAVQGIQLDSRRALAISFVAHFFNSFLLGSTGGDLMKAYYAAHETHHKKTEAVMTVIVDRLIGLWAMLLFAGFMMIPNLTLLRSHERLGMLSLIVLLMLGGCSVIMAVSFHGGISRIISGARNWLKRLPKGDVLERSLDATRKFGVSPWFITKTMGVSMILNLVCVLQLMVLSDGLDQNIRPSALFVIVPMIICISAIPITPSGLGVRENLFVLMLSSPPLFVDSTSALSLSLLAYGGSLFWSLVGGVVYTTMKRRKDFQTVSAEEQQHR